MRVLITGGAGFIGCHLVHCYLNRGEEVVLLDNFSRQGTRFNLEWLKANHGERLEVIEADLRFDEEKVKRAVSRAEVVFHLAAQVAVTTSVKNPREDFETNALGTFNLLEAARKSAHKPIFFYSSTNKVYGRMGELKVEEKDSRYRFKDLPAGVDELRPLDFYSPYGCSKGAADQYVRDYARIYGLKTVVFRQSCIYGTRQFGVEDQGWIAHFVISSIFGKPLSIYGNGKQVRDLLYIDDMVEAFAAALKNIDKAAGKVYNIGGGTNNQLSLLELLSLLEKLLNKKIEPSFSDWRPGDQPIYVSNIARARKDLGWEPRVGVEEGVKRLLNWAEENRELLKKVYR